MAVTVPNRLSRETSPYLKQHALNPVDWFPWGDEAFAKARERDRPIFLSVGYSACHWCHVMEHESFEDPDVARFLNDHFVSIKVDREERPDVDQIYMTAVQILSGQGGWPMSVFLTPEGKPFFGGTYYPPRPSYGRPSFLQVLQAVLQAWSERRDALDQQAGQLTAAIQEQMQVRPTSDELSLDLLRDAQRHLGRAFDQMHGGFGSAPKFPHAQDIRLLLRCARRFNDASAKDMALKSLDHMARGGIFDHLGGGFHRYSTDARWLVPHFEKMLYDNALLTLAYLEAYQETRNPQFREVAEDTLDYVLREMTSPQGAFFSAQDADSEGVEGKFFVWSLAEVEAILGPDADVFCDVFDITREGNWEGHNILNRPKTHAQSARLLRMDEADLQARLRSARAQLYQHRCRRVPPGLDDKILTSWNALMISAFAQAAAVLDRSDYATSAAAAAQFLLNTMRCEEGRLFRTCGQEGVPKLNAYLDDYAYLIDALVTLHEITFDPHWIESALALADVLIEQFWDSDSGGFFYTGKDHEQLVARTKDPHDGSTPSGNSMAVTALLRLAKLTGRRDLEDMAVQTMRLFQGIMASMPTAAGQMLIALDLYFGPTHELVIIGDPRSVEWQEASRALWQTFWPNKVVTGCRPDRLSDHSRILPLLQGKSALGPITVYRCKDFACEAPWTDLPTIKEGLSGNS